MNDVPVFVLAIETARRKSIGPVLRCAAAFGVSGTSYMSIKICCLSSLALEIYIVGSNHYSTHGAHGAQNHLQVLINAEY